MNEEKARALIGAWIMPDNSLDSMSTYIYWEPEQGARGITIDNDRPESMSADTLEAIVWWMRNKGEGKNND